MDDILVRSGTSCPSEFNGKFCDFESDNLCGFTDYPLGKLNWQRKKGKSDKISTGPPYDHV